MKRLACVTALALGLAMVMPAAPAIAEVLVQNTSDQLEEVQELDAAGQQTVAQTYDAAGDAVEAAGQQAVAQTSDEAGDAVEAAGQQAVAKTSDAAGDAVDEDGDVDRTVDDEQASVDESEDQEGEAATAVASASDDSALEELPNVVAPETPNDCQMAVTMEAEEPEGEVAKENTVYTIVASDSSSGKAKAASVVVGVAKNDPSSNANVALTKSNGGLGNDWRLVARKNGSWSIINMLADKALAVSGTPTSGANVKVVSGKGTSWIIEKNDDGTVSFIPFGYDSLRLDIWGGGTNAGANIHLYKKNNTSAQRFFLRASSALTEALVDGEKLDEGIVTINTILRGKKLIDIYGGSKKNGANVQMYSLNGSLAQKFVLADVGNNLYTLQSCASGKFLDTYRSGTKSGTNVQQNAGSGMLSQLWYFIGYADGNLSLRNAKSGLALSVHDALTSNGANVELETVLRVKRQRFTVKNVNLLEKGEVMRLLPSDASTLNISTSASSAMLSQKGGTADGWWKVSATNGRALKLASMFGGKKLTISGDVASGADVILASGVGTSWVVTVNDGGTFTLSPKGNLKLSLDVYGGKMEVGKNIQIYKSNGTGAQQFVVGVSKNLTRAARTALTKKPFPECVFTVRSALGSGLVLDVKDSSRSNGANVQLFSSKSANTQTWELQYAGSGMYHIKSVGSKLYLGVAGSASGSNVAQYKSSDMLTQYWYFESNGDGTNTILNVGNGLSLDVRGGRAASGANVQLYKSNGTNAQKWKMSDTPLIKNGTYAFSSDLTEYGMLVLEVKDGSKASGANVQVYQTKGTNAQKWVVTYKGSGIYTLASKNSGLLLSVADSSRANGGNVVQKASENSDYQRWAISMTDSDGFVFKNVGSGRVLDIKGGRSDNGVNVQQYTANGTRAQSWHIKTNHYLLPSGKLGKLVSRMIYYTDIINVGYDQLTPDRWNIRNGGECDCSSLVINCLREAGFRTGDVSSHIGRINAGEPYDGCTYTGNMSYNLTNRGWSRLSFSLSKLRPGDILLNDAYHTCVVISGSGSNALIAQASIDENYYGWGGKPGDQTGYETNIKKAYVYGYGWDCILRYNS